MGRPKIDPGDSMARQATHQERMAAAFKGLSMEERVVAKLLCFPRMPKTLDETGLIMGITKERVRQIQEGAFKKIKDELILGGEMVRGLVRTERRELAVNRPTPKRFRTPEQIEAFTRAVVDYRAKFPGRRWCDAFRDIANDYKHPQDMCNALHVRVTAEERRREKVQVRGE